LSGRKVDVACIQETRWKGSGCKFCGAKGKRYKLFWMGGKERSHSLGIFIAQKWADSVVSVERHSKRVLIFKMVLDSGLLNVYQSINCYYVRQVNGVKLADILFSLLSVCVCVRM